MKLIIKLTGEDDPISSTGYRYKAVAMIAGGTIYVEDSTRSYHEALGKLIIALRKNFSEIDLDLSEFMA